MHPQPSQPSSHPSTAAAPAVVTTTEARLLSTEEAMRTLNRQPAQQSAAPHNKSLHVKTSMNGTHASPPVGAAGGGGGGRGASNVLSPPNTAGSVSSSTPAADFSLSDAIRMNPVGDSAGDSASAGNSQGTGEEGASSLSQTSRDSAAATASATQAQSSATQLAMLLIPPEFHSIHSLFKSKNTLLFVAKRKVRKVKAPTPAPVVQTPEPIKVDGVARASLAFLTLPEEEIDERNSAGEEEEVEEEREVIEQVVLKMPNIFHDIVQQINQAVSVRASDRCSS